MSIITPVTLERHGGGARTGKECNGLDVFAAKELMGSRGRAGRAPMGRSRLITLFC